MFTKWFKGAHSRSGTLWKDWFKSVIVEDGVAARTIAVCIDLNPVKAGLLKDLAERPWSSYGGIDGAKELLWG
jgi:putative transposase